LAAKHVRAVVLGIVITLAITSAFVARTTEFSTLAKQDYGSLIGGGTPATSPAKSTPAEPTPLNRIDTGLLSGYAEPMNLVINNQDVWATVWTRLAACPYGCPPAPSIDFKTRTVIAVFLGMRGTGGYIIQVSRIESGNNAVVVHAVVTSPDRNCFEPQIITEPYDLVDIPKASGTTTFVVETVITNCG